MSNFYAVSAADASARDRLGTAYEPRLSRLLPHVFQFVPHMNRLSPPTETADGKDLWRYGQQHAEQWRIGNLGLLVEDGGWGKRRLG